MGSRTANAAVTVTGLICCLLLVTPFYATTAPPAKKRKPKAPPKPVITAARRSAAQSQVELFLANSAPSPIRQAGALVPVFEQLYRMSSGESDAPVHIIHFGDSHTAADEWTGGLRDFFQQRFGDGGSGFSLAGHPFVGYRRFDARGGATNGWRSEGLRTGAGDGFFGLGGISITARRGGESAYLDADCDHLEIHYLQQPGGGTLELYVDGEHTQDIPTEGEFGPGAASVMGPSGYHRFKLVSADSRPVRLFGWVADKSSGVTYEALGINGAEASVMLRWNAEMMATYMQRRNPGLIVLAYGTNEATDPNWNSESYQVMFSQLLQRVRRDTPTASILVLGPDDRWQRVRGTWKRVEGIDRIIAAQRQACRENACAYWDTRQRMGGPGSMREWVYAGLAQPDYVHFTSAGYRRLAAILFEDLMQQYDAYKQARPVPSPNPYGQPKQDR